MAKGKVVKKTAVAAMVALATLNVVSMRELVKETIAATHV